MVLCSCGKHHLDPDNGDAYGCRLCPACFDLSGWENAHSDYDHETTPDGNCPFCTTVTG